MEHVDRVHGSCLCGKVRFQARLPSRWCAHCHCSRCRKAHGAGYVTWAGFPEDAFELTSDPETLEWYRSSPEAERAFCHQCGSSLLFRSTRWPGEIHVAVGALDDPLDRAPQAHVHHDDHVDWVVIDDALAVYGRDG
ncbi:MAG: GFA family protein [Gammaproteobacteria bacterium]